MRRSTETPLSRPRLPHTQARASIGAHASMMLQRIEVTTVLHKKFEAIFDQVLPASASPLDAATSASRSGGRRDPSHARLARRRKTDAEDGRLKIKQFVWTLFLYAKGSTANTSLDLVSSFCLLLCIINFAYQNARQEPSMKNDAYETDSSTLRALCRRHAKATVVGSPKKNQELDLLTDASILNERLWKPFVVKHTVEGGMLELTHELLGAFAFIGKTDARRNQWDYAPRDPRTPLDRNLNNVSRAYEALMLEQGMVDERAFLAAEPAMSGALALTQLKTPQSFHKHRTKNKNLLSLSATMPTRSPVSRALNSIVMLKSLAGPGCPSDKIPATFSSQIDAFAEVAASPKPSPDWCTSVLQRVASFRAKFIAAMAARIRGSEDVATERYELATAFYYKALESILAMEMQSRPTCSGLDSVLHHEAFHSSLISCSVEITLFAYQSDRTLFKFPWVLETFGLDPFEFHKIIEIVIRAESSLSAATIKHLSRCENAVILQYAWQGDSSLRTVLAGAQKKSRSTAAAGLPTEADGGMPPAADRCQTPTLDSGNTAFPASATDKSLRALAIFYRKTFHLARLRLEHICNKLKIPQDVGLLASACFRHAIEDQSVILPGCHLDQLMMCSIHAIFIVAGKDAKIQFSDIIKEYRRLPQADPRVCYEVPLPAGRGDIIAYYNQVFVPAMQTFIFTLVEKCSQKDLRAPNAMPFPELKNKRIHSPRRVARCLSLTVCPIPASRILPSARR